MVCVVLTVAQSVVSTTLIFVSVLSSYACLYNPPKFHVFLLCPPISVDEVLLFTWAQLANKSCLVGGTPTKNVSLFFSSTVPSNKPAVDGAATTAAGASAVETTGAVADDATTKGATGATGAGGSGAPPTVVATDGATTAIARASGAATMGAARRGIGRGADGCRDGQRDDGDM